MIPEDTIRRRCKRCKKVVLVASMVPCRSSWLLNGIWLRSMDENYNEHNVGFLCFECAFCLPWERMTIPDFNRGFGLSFGGGIGSDLALWEAMLDGAYKP